MNVRQFQNMQRSKSAFIDSIDEDTNPIPKQRTNNSGVKPKAKPLKTEIEEGSKSIVLDTPKQRILTNTHGLLGLVYALTLFILTYYWLKTIF